MDNITKRRGLTDTEMQEYPPTISARILMYGTMGKPSKLKPQEIAKELLKVVFKDDKRYHKLYEELKSVATGKNWGEVLSKVYEDRYEMNEIFVRLVEEKEGVTITSVEQLQKVTGIDEITVPGGTKEQEKEEAFKQIQDVFFQGLYYRYSSVLEALLRAGAKYKDLQVIEPSFFNLPDNWKQAGMMASDKYTTILEVIGGEFALADMGTGGLSMLPSLRLMAKELDAPYSVMMDAYQMFSPYDRNTNPSLRKREEEIKDSVFNRMPNVISEQPESWKRDRGFDNPNDKSYDFTLKFFRDSVFMIVKSLAHERIYKVIGKPGFKHPVDWAENWVEWVKDHFEDEINQYVELTLNEGTRGNSDVEQVLKQIAKHTR